MTAPASVPPMPAEFEELLEKYAELSEYRTDVAVSDAPMSAVKKVDEELKETRDALWAEVCRRVEAARAEVGRACTDELDRLLRESPPEYCEPFTTARDCVLLMLTNPELHAALSSPPAREGEVPRD